LVIVVTSDFARGPEYNSSNDGAGKDHWPITSVLLLGPGIRGGRVLGATDDKQASRKLNPSTLALDDAGVALTPGHIHQQLRRLAGIADSRLVATYPIPDQPLALFS
jgi:uncharacterized protein (DUF1501 family)